MYQGIREDSCVSVRFEKAIQNPCDEIPTDRKTARSEERRVGKEC